MVTSRSGKEQSGQTPDRKNILIQDFEGHMRSGECKREKTSKKGVPIQERRKLDPRGIAIGKKGVAVPCKLRRFCWGA